MPRLIRLSGEGIGAEQEIGSPCVLGRAAGCGIRIEEESVSREHARIFERGGAWEVVDLQSRNGTFVNGRRVTRAILKPGDELALGRVQFRFAADPPKGAVIEEIALEEGPEASVPTTPAVPPSRRVASFSAAPPAGESARPLPARAPAVPLGETRAVTRTGAGALLVAGASSPGGVLREDVGQRGFLFRVGLAVVLLALSAGVFFAAKVVTGFLARPASPEEAEAPASPDGSSR